MSPRRPPCAYRHILVDTAQPESALRGKRIRFLFGSFFLGGAERQGLHLARYLKERVDADVEVWAFWHPDGAAQPAREVCEKYHLPWRLVPFGWGQTRLARIAGILEYGRRLRRLRPDCLLPYTMGSNVLCGNVWRLAGARACIWNQRDEGRERCPVRWERRAVKGTPCFISNSAHGVAFLHEVLGVPQEKIHVIFNGVTREPPQLTPRAWCTALGVDSEVFLACMVAHLTAFKDHATLLRAWRLVLDRLTPSGINPVLLLAGRLEGPAMSLKALAYDLQLGQSVRFLGPVTDVAGLLRTVQLGVHSSKFEGVPNGVLECMAAGLPVVATDIPGIREALGPEGVEHLAPPGADALLAERIIRFARDRQLTIEVGRRNQNRIDREFSVERMCQRTASLIAATMTHRAGERYAPGRT
jgi:glycosyltransferase involved in cell wall biosynthesis